MTKFRRTRQRVATAKAIAGEPDKPAEIMALKRAVAATNGQTNRAAVRYLKNQKRRGKL